MVSATPGQPAGQPTRESDSVPRQTPLHRRLRRRQSTATPSGNVERPNERCRSPAASTGRCSPSALVLGAFGIVMVASALSGNEIYKDYPWRQALFLGVGLVLMFVAAAIDYRLLTTLAYPIYLFFLAALVVIKVIGTVAGGAQRWLTVGEFFLQPSELTKIALILALAHFLSSREEKMESIFTPILAFGMLIPAVALIFWQPNLGTALVVVAIGAIMILVAGLRWRHAAFFAALAAAAARPRPGGTCSKTI